MRLPTGYIIYAVSIAGLCLTKAHKRSGGNFKCTPSNCAHRLVAVLTLISKGFLHVFWSLMLVYLSYQTVFWFKTRLLRMTSIWILFGKYSPRIYYKWPHCDSPCLRFKYWLTVCNYYCRCLYVPSKLHYDTAGRFCFIWIRFQKYSSWINQKRTRSDFLSCASIQPISKERCMFTIYVFD